MHQTFIALLISQGVLSQLQVNEAWELARKTGIPLEYALVQRGYLTPSQVVGALAEIMGVAFLEVDNRTTIPPAILELVPESLARERVILPLAQVGNRLFVAMTAPLDNDTLQALQFILNKDIWPVPASREDILEAINRNYGPAEQESVDSMLAVFCDTAIDFCESEPSVDKRKDIFETDFDLPALEGEEAGSDVRTLEDSDDDLQSSDFELAIDEVADELLLDDSPESEEAEPAIKPRHRLECFANVMRQATVRYYHRMNPERLFPLLVVISKRAIEEAIKKNVAQKQSRQFQVVLDSVVEIEPILPGCDCYPPREQVAIGRGEVTAKFYVVPQVIGRLMHARVVVRQEGQVLAEVPLEVHVVKQGLTVLMGGLSLVLPFVSMVLKHFHLDFESQLANGFDLYAVPFQLALRSLSPGGLAALLLLLTAASFLWLRPRKRDVFWDIRPIEPDRATKADKPTNRPLRSQGSKAPETVRPGDTPGRQDALFASAENCYLRKDFAAALRFYESGLVLRPAPAVIYHHASLTAHYLGNTGRALTILEDAAARLPRNRMKGAMWFNMGCFAARLNRPVDAVGFLNRAIDAGYTNLDKYRGDPDLDRLRWRPDFKRLLGYLEDSAVGKR